MGFVSSWRENFSETYPEYKYLYSFYTDASHPNCVTTARRKAPNISGNANNFFTYTYSDGLGRTIQTQGPSEEAGKMMISGPVTYNSQGLVYRQYVGYKATSSGTYIASPSMEKPTTFTYDPIGRVTQTDYPDGTNTKNIYNKLVSASIDQMGRYVQYTTDAYGRNLTTSSFTGTYPTLATYSITTTEYDALGRPVKTIDAQGNQNTVTYDNLGQKVAMHDMDMGNWTYQYDLVGRLIKQVDAKDQAVTMQYDNANQLIRKNNLNGSYVNYFYESFPGYTGTNSAGRLVREENFLQPKGQWNTFYEGNMSSLADSSGHSNNGTISGAVWPQGKVGLCLNFDGVDDYVELSAPSFNGQNNWTFEAWIKPQASGSDRFIYSEGVAACTLNIKLATNNSIAVSTWNANRSGNWDTYSTAANVVANGAWSHIAVTLSNGQDAAHSGTIKVYVNGILAGTGTLGHEWHSSAIYAAIGRNIGSLHSGGQAVAPFKGSIDEIKAIGRVLTQSEINNDRNNTLTTGWGLNESAASQANDVTPNLNDAYLYGATWTTGKYGKGVQFDGVNDYLDVKHPRINGTTNWTFEAWVKPQASSGDRNIYSEGIPACTLYINLGTNNSISVATWNRSRTSNWDTYTTAANVVANDAWSHIAVTLENGGNPADSGTVKVYVNGSLVSTGALGHEWHSSTLYAAIGRNIGSTRGGGQAVAPFKGIIDEVYIHGVSLSQAQIQSEMANPQMMKIGNNIVTNTDLSAASWNKSYETDISYRTDGPAGTLYNVARFKNNNGNALGYWFAYGDYAPQEDSTQYKINLWAKAPNAAYNVRAYTAGSGETDRHWGSYMNVPADGQWHLLEWAITTGSPSDSDSLSFEFTGCQANAYIEISCPQMIKTSPSTRVELRLLLRCSRPLHQVRKDHRRGHIPPRTPMMPWTGALLPPIPMAA